MVQIFGWLSADAALASRRKRSSDCRSWATFSGRNFSATKRSSRVSSAFVHDAHAAAAELLDNAVMRDHLANHSFPPYRAEILRLCVGQVNQIGGVNGTLENFDGW